MDSRAPTVLVLSYVAPLWTMRAPGRAMVSTLAQEAHGKVPNQHEQLTSQPSLSSRQDRKNNADLEPD